MLRTFLIALFIFSISISCKKETGTASTTIPVIPSPPATSVDSTIVGDYLALGDSYTIGQSVSVIDRFPNQAVLLLETDSILLMPEIIAQTGWTTGDLLSRLRSKPPLRATYDIVTLLIGVNNQYQGRTQSEYRVEFDSLLNRAVAYAGFDEKRVIVLSIPDYTVTPFGIGRGAESARQIDSFNIINSQLTSTKGCNYLNITASSRQALNDRTLIASDGLHPSAKEYYKWAFLLAPIIKQAIR